MGRRSGLGAFLASAALLALASPALAGGWAVTTFDELPAEYRVDTTYRLGYTVLQHGRAPAPGLETGIRIQSAASSGAQLFRGVPQGAPGHYVAEVRFPAEGQWRWDVIQGPYQPQALGTVAVLPAAPLPAAPLPAARPPAPAPAAEPSAGDLAALRVVLPVATALAVALFGVQLVPVLRRARRAAPADAPRAARVAG